MKIKDILHEAHRPFPSIEIDVTCHRDEYEYRQEADGSLTRHIVRNKVSEVAVCTALMSAYKIDVVPHVICGGNTAADVENKLSDLRFLGVENIMALRGDSVAGERRFVPCEGGYRYADGSSRAGICSVSEWEATPRSISRPRT